MRARIIDSETAELIRQVRRLVTCLEIDLMDKEPRKIDNEIIKERLKVCFRTLENINGLTDNVLQQWD